MFVSVPGAIPAQPGWNCLHEVLSCTYEGISFSLSAAHPPSWQRWQAGLPALPAGKSTLLRCHLRLLSPRQPCHAVHVLSKESRQQFTHCQCEDKHLTHCRGVIWHCFLRNMLILGGITKSWLLYFLVTCSCEMGHSCSVAIWTLFQG